MTNIIEVYFGNSTLVFAKTQYKYNSGMLLKFADLDLPESYQVHFSNSNTGASVEMVGNSDGVEIPYNVWQTGKTIYAWVYLHPTEDSSVTVYECRIPISERAQLPTLTPTDAQQTAIDTAITALNNAVDACEDAVEQTETNVTHYPIITDGYWYVWDAETSAYVNTNVKAEGTDGTNGTNGVGIASTVLNADYTLTITFTDGTTYTTSSIRGQDGTDGQSFGFNVPCIIIPTDASGTVTTAQSVSFDIVCDAEYSTSYKVSCGGITLKTREYMDGYGYLYSDYIAFAYLDSEDGSGSNPTATITQTIIRNTFFSSSQRTGMIPFTVTIDGITHTIKLPWVAVPTA